MSQENVEVVLDAIEALNRRDVDAFIATLGSDIEWEDSVFWTEPIRVYTGEAELREWFNQVVLEPWDRLHFEAEEIADAADDRVLVGGLLTTRGKGSGVDTEVRGWSVVWITNGKITRRQIFLDRDDALEAAGLRE